MESNVLQAAVLAVVIAAVIVFTPVNSARSR
jgi:hypothetical protein